MKKLLIIFCLMSSFINAMQIDKKNLHVPGRLGDISVFKTDNGFEIEEADATRVIIPSHRLDKYLRRMNTCQLAKFIQSGYLAVNKSEDGQYSLDAIGRLKGGGPVLAYWFYGVTKAVCWGAVAGAALYGANKIIESADTAVSGNGVVKHVLEDKVDKVASYSIIKELSVNTMTSGAGIPRVISGSIPGVGVFVADKVSNSEDASFAVGTVATGVVLSAQPAQTAVVGTCGILSGAIIEAVSLAAGAVGAWIPFL